ncbi:MAG: SbcC/MukB-like Walker B domain-containing protein, partial [Jatrophihabitantaceae bacterium]
AAERARETAERLAQVPGELRRAEVSLVAARARAARLDAAEQRGDAVGERLRAALRREALGTLLAAARAQRAAAIDVHQEAVDTHQRLLDARLAGIAAELAAELADGQPCAVCGSTEHPAPAVSAADAVTAEDVGHAARRREQAADGRHGASEREEELERESAAALAVCGTAAVAKLRGEAEVHRAEADEAAAAALSLDPLAAARTALEQELATLGDVHAEATAAEASAREQRQNARREVRELAAELVDAAGPHASVAARQQVLRREAERCAALAAAVRVLSEALAGHAAATRRAAGEASAQGFADLPAAQAAVRTDAEQAGLQRRVDDWLAEAQRLHATAAAAEFAGLDPAAAARLAQRGADERQRARSAEQRAEASAGAAELARSAVERFARCRAELERVQAELDGIEERVAPVVYLARLTQGKTGQRRVALTTYVLRHWFERVVQAANVRLANMSSARFELVRVDEAGGRAERAGLTLEVLDRHTGEQRSTRSLSGGETFYTSLALALGLADVVRAEAGGVDLDTLFIDEGFGSLDADTLDAVMSVIDELRDRGRVVGIVSHVSELKDRIAERVEVRRLPDGSSELRVVA